MDKVTGLRMRGSRTMFGKLKRKRHLHSRCSNVVGRLDYGKMICSLLDVSKRKPRGQLVRYVEMLRYDSEFAHDVS